MKKNPNKLWIVAFALGWLADFLFWKKTPGINFAVFVAMCLLAAFYLLLTDGLRPRPATAILILPFAFFAAATFIRAESMTVFLAVVFTLLSMALIAVSYLGGRWYLYALTDYFAKALQLFGSAVSRPIMFMNDVRKEQKEAGVQPSKYNFMPIVRGILIALPIVAVFAALLSSADAVFGQQVGNILKWFKLDNLPELIFRFVYIVVIGYALAGIILHAATESMDEKLTGEDKPFMPAFLGFTESSIVLGSVIVLFAAFVTIQFQYFFGGNANINVAGYTYSEYARRGFGELVTVAFFALLMLLTLNSITKRETESQRKIYSGLGVALVALLLVMLFSAFKRLGLYEAAYGFSRLRTYTHVFLIWLGLLLVTVIALEIFRKERMFTFAMLVAAFGFAVSLPILNVDAFIVNQNIQREIHPKAKDSAELDAGYFVELSDDAIPPLVSAYRDSATPDALKEKIGAALTCIQYRRSLSRDSSWQSFHFAQANADKSLKTAEDSLKKFKLDKYNQDVTTPSGEQIP
ncbi:MAG: DUF4173 domain-containing protein, partial [Anaerolineales bacterium]|nr:DUF4173 domain-containing protein [Anaerolineales bacterium]